MFWRSVEDTDDETEDTDDDGRGNLYVIRVPAAGAREVVCHHGSRSGAAGSCMPSRFPPRNLVLA